MSGSKSKNHIEIGRERKRRTEVERGRDISPSRDKEHVHVNLLGSAVRLETVDGTSPSVTFLAKNRNARHFLSRWNFYNGSVYKVSSFFL